MADVKLNMTMGIRVVFKVSTMIDPLISALVEEIDCKTGAHRCIIFKLFRKVY